MDSLEFKESFVRNLLQLRYRGTKVCGYTSRFHYSTDWLYNAVKNGILKDISKEIGGESLNICVCFMSENASKYPLLASDTRRIDTIRACEQEINAREYYYIPKENIRQMEDRINPGDIVLITTNIKGLDTSHLGIAIRKGNRIYLAHASSNAKKVVISDVPLCDYMAKIKHQSGIIVATLQ